MRPFRDRIDAAQQLARLLAGYRGRHPVILAIPRGAVPMGRVLADALGGELDVVLVRKLGAPLCPELAVGAVDESGCTHVAPHAAEAGADRGYLEAEVRRQLELLRRRRAAYSPLRAPIDVRGRIAIVVDDGLATGETMIAALHGVRARQPARLVCAVPVASSESLARVRPLADDTVCVHVDDHARSVGAAYGDFSQVEDEEVIACLREVAPRPGTPTGAGPASPG